MPAIDAADRLPMEASAAGRHNQRRIQADHERLALAVANARMELAAQASPADTGLTQAPLPPWVSPAIAGGLTAAVTTVALPEDGRMAPALAVGLAAVALSTLLELGLRRSLDAARPHDDKAQAPRLVSFWVATVVASLACGLALLALTSGGTLPAVVASLAVLAGGLTILGLRVPAVEQSWRLGQVARRRAEAEAKLAACIENLSWYERHLAPDLMAWSHANTAQILSIGRPGARSARTDDFGGEEDLHEPEVN
jgi:hypothetical protein